VFGKKNLELFLITLAILGVVGTTLITFKTREYLDKKTVIPQDDLQVYQPKTVVAVGDIVCDPADAAISDSKCQMEKTYELAAGQKPSAVLALGDLQYNNGTFDKFQAAYSKSWGQLKEITYPAAGNHEYGTTGASGYFDYFNGVDSSTGRAGDRSSGYYSFNLGFWHAISLNANCEKVGGCSEGSAQYQWLKKDLENNKTRRCTLAFWHQPHFSSGPHGAEAADTARSVPFWDLLYANHADLVLNGHDHLYERFSKQDPNGKTTTTGLRQFTVGTGGGSLYSVSKPIANSEKTFIGFGILTLKLYKQAYQWAFLSTQNQIIDSGTERCNI
jgi:hypothetical protein